METFRGLSEGAQTVLKEAHWKRLREKRTCPESLQSLFVVPRGVQQKNGSGRPRSPQVLDHRSTVKTASPQADDDHIALIVLGNSDHVGSVTRDGDDVSETPEALGDESNDTGMFCEQDTHMLTMALGA